MTGAKVPGDEALGWTQTSPIVESGLRKKIRDRKNGLELSRTPGVRTRGGNVGVIKMGKRERKGIINWLQGLKKTWRGRRLGWFGTAGVGWDRGVVWNLIVESKFKGGIRRENGVSG